MRSFVTVAGFLLLLSAALAQDGEPRLPGLSVPLPEPAPLRGDLPLGFVMHWGEKGQDEYVGSGAPSMLMNLFFWNMRDQDRQLVDFSRAESWLAYLYRTGLTSAVIIDTSIPWRAERTRALGENVVDPGGNVTSYSSPLSPEYRRMVDQYVQDLTGWIAAHDTEHRVTTYVNGAEVFWPGTLDFGPLAETDFRAWLMERYGSLDAVNARWGARFASRDEIRVVPVRRIGAGLHGPCQFVMGDVDNGAWVLPLQYVAAGQRYELVAEIRVDPGTTGMADLLVAWTAENHPPLHSQSVTADLGEPGWQRLRLEVTAPDWARNGAVYFHFEGRGEVRWRRVGGTVLETGQGAFATDTEGEGDDGYAWAEAVWNGDPEFAVDRVEGEPVRVHSARDTAIVLGFDPSVYWYDFQTYSMERYARVMNHWAQRIGECDPTREVMHYLGFLLGTLSQWDDLMMTQRADVFLSNAPDVDIHGLQLCAGNGDFHFATVNLDLARKYGKPMVATDLQDFTHGTYVGFNSLNRTTLASIAHGMDGAYYYCWYDFNIDYNWYGNWPMVETRRMVDQARDCIRFLSGAELETSVAFLLPLQPCLDRDPEGGKSDVLDTMGWYKMVCQAGACPDVITPYELQQPGVVALDRYDVVILPDCPVLPVDVAEALVAYLADGGTIVLGGRAPVRDETGAELERDLDVVAAPGPDSEPVSVAVGRGRAVRFELGAGRTYLGPVRRHRVAGNTPPLFLSDDGQRWPRPEGRELLERVHGCLRDAGVLPVRLAAHDPDVELSAYRADDHWRVVLVHTGPGMHHGGRLLVPGVDGRRVKVLADFEEREQKAEVRDDGVGVVDLPVFSDSCLVRW
jgi:hypothetical protein